MTTLEEWNDIRRERDELMDKNGALQTRVEELEALINRPEVADFITALQKEAAHQVERWAPGHDERKLPGDWSMLLDKIKGKQAQACWDHDWVKYRHHLITMAAICANAHRCVPRFEVLWPQPSAAGKAE